MISKVIQPGGISVSPAPCATSSLGGISFGASDTFSISLITKCICIPSVGCPYFTTTFSTTLALTQIAVGSFRYRTSDGSGGNIDTTCIWTQNLVGDWMWSVSIALQHQPGYNASNLPSGSPCDGCGCSSCSWMYFSGGNTLGPNGENVPTMIDKSNSPYGGSDSACGVLAPSSECCLSIEVSGTLNTCADQTLPASAGWYGYNYGTVASP